MNQYTNNPAPNGFDGQTPVRPNSTMAGIALACGIVAMIIPIPVVNIIVGLLGMVLSRMSHKTGVGGLAIGGLVVSIVGTVFAFFYTILILIYGPMLFETLFEAYL